MSQRLSRILTGIISLALFFGLSVFGIEAGAGKLSPKYHLSGMFGSAGQGLISGSDVKIHGINVGQVTSVHLVQGRALVNMALHTDQKVPTDASATIRAKTLFGEKFVDIDPGPNEARGPFLRNHGVIHQTTGGFELERVLSDAYPILKAINPDELGTLVDTLARGGEGTGEQVNRQIGNFRKLSDINVAHDADTRQFLDDLAQLSGELADRAPDLVNGARDLNIALPDLNARGDELATVLDQASRLSSDLADVLEANRSFSTKSVTEGSKTIQLLYDKRERIGTLVHGLREFFQVISEAGDHIDDPSSPGTTLAAVLFVAGGGPPCGRPPASCPGGAAPPGSASTRAPATARPAPTAPLPLPSVPTIRLPAHASGMDGIIELIGGQS